MVKIAHLCTALVFAAFAVVSCNKEVADGDVSKVTVSVNFLPSVSSKAQEPYDSETAISGVKLFIERVGTVSEDPEPYAVYYAENGSVDVDLEFSDTEDYSYSFKAYANFGDVSEKPEVVEFSGYFDKGMKMYGESLIDREAASNGSLSMLLKRYVGKVVVNSVKLGWSADYTGSFTLDAIYIANAGKDNTLNAECYYNLEGTRTVTDMDQYLYEDLGNISMSAGDIHSQQHFFYAYAGFTSDNFTSLVFEVTYAGEKMYYTISLDYLAENSCTVYDFIITGAGCDKPYGDKMSIEKSPISVLTQTFAAEEWDTYNEKVYSEGTGYVDTEVELNPDYN